MSRTPLIVVFFISAVVASAQTAGDFVSRYGDPNVERFIIRPGVTLTVAYASDRTGCQMTVQPRHSILKNDNELELMPRKIVREVLEQVLRESSGESLLRNIEEVVGCDVQVHSTHYDVTINTSQSHTCHASEDGVANMSIVREDRPCGTSDSSEVFIAQRAIDIHTQYGVPDAQRYVARPGIALRVSYGGDQSPCEMLIDRTGPIIQRDMHVKYMRPEVVTEILDEVLPQSDRGIQLRRTVTKSGCTNFEIIDYENATITRTTHTCDLPNPEIEGAATVTRRNPSCGIQK